MNKKVVCLMLTVCMLVSGCGKKEEPVKEVESVETQTVETQVETEEAVETESESETETETAVELGVDELGEILSNSLNDADKGFSITYTSEGFTVIIEARDKICHMNIGEGNDLWIAEDYIYACADNEWIKGAAKSSDEADDESPDIASSLDPADMAQQIIDSFGSVDSVSMIDTSTYTFNATAEEYDSVTGTIELNDDGSLKELIFEYEIDGRIIPASLTSLTEDLAVPEEALNAKEVSDEEISMAVLTVMFTGLSTIMPEEFETGEESTDVQVDTESITEEDEEVTGDISYSIDGVDLSKTDMYFADKTNSMTYDDYVNYCKATGIKQEFTDSNKYYFVYAFTEDSKCDVTLGSVVTDYDHDEIILDVNMNNHTGSGSEYGYAVIVQLDKPINGSSVTRGGY